MFLSPFLQILIIPRKVVKVAIWMGPLANSTLLNPILFLFYSDNIHSILQTSNCFGWNERGEYFVRSIGINNFRRDIFSTDKMIFTYFGSRMQIASLHRLTHIVYIRIYIYTIYIYDIESWNKFSIISIWEYNFLENGVRMIKFRPAVVCELFRFE